jgi:hypothetical protein
VIDNTETTKVQDLIIKHEHYYKQKQITLTQNKHNKRNSFIL